MSSTSPITLDEVIRSVNTNTGPVNKDALDKCKQDILVKISKVDGVLLGPKSDVEQCGGEGLDRMNFYREHMKLIAVCPVRKCVCSIFLCFRLCRTRTETRFCSRLSVPLLVPIVRNCWSWPTAITSARTARYNLLSSLSLSLCNR